MSKKFLLVTGLLASFSVACFADTTPAAAPAAATSTTESPTLWSTIKENVKVTYEGDLTLNSLGNLGGATTMGLPDKDGNIGEGDRIYLYNILGVSYKLGTTGLKAFFSPRVIWTIPAGNELSLDDWKVGVSGLKYTNGDLTVSSSFYLQLPMVDWTSGATKAQVMTYGISPSINYSFGKTGLSVGSAFIARYYTYAVVNDKNKAARDLRFHAFPSISYAPTSAIELNLTLETGTSRPRNADLDFAKFNAETSDLVLTFGWSVTDKINLSPYIRAFPFENYGATNGKVSFVDTMTIGIYGSAGIL